MGYCGFHKQGHQQGHAGPEVDPACPLCEEHSDHPPDDLAINLAPPTPQNDPATNPFRWWFFSLQQIPVWRAIVFNCLILALMGIYGFQVVTEGAIPSGFELILGITLGFFLARTR